jgi:chromosomal replication initiation ATPase DnaA
MMPPAIRILHEVATAHGFTLAEIRSSDKKGGDPMFKARSEAARRLRAERGLPLSMIGRFLGGRDHSTIRRMLDDEVRQTSIAESRRKRSEASP